MEKTIKVNRNIYLGIIAIVNYIAAYVMIVAAIACLFIIDDKTAMGIYLMIGGVVMLSAGVIVDAIKQIVEYYLNKDDHPFNKGVSYRGVNTNSEKVSE